MQAKFYDQVTSTQILAKEYLTKGATESAFFAAKSQSAGYGKQGRHFYSPQQGLYLSLALPDFKVKMNQQGLVTLSVGLSLLTTLKDEFGLNDLKLKWVNDLYLADKKVAGVLCEKIAEGLIIGVGLNLNTASFPSELKNKAASLKVKNYDFDSLAKKIAQAINKAAKTPAKDLVAIFNQYSYLNKKKVSLKVGKKTYQGKVCGINQLGELILELAGKTQTFNSGEVIKVDF